MRKINAGGLALLKRFEGCVLHAYKCPAGIQTIGWGHTGDVKEGMTITQHQADVILEEVDLPIFEAAVEKLCATVGLSDNEFSALVCLAYNIGVANLSKSTLLKKLLLGQRRGAADEFLKWDKAKGKVLPGLVKRRAAERDLFRLDLDMPPSVVRV